MPSRKSLPQMRVASLVTWAKTQSLPDIGQDTFTSLFAHIRSKQSASGFWTMEGKDWNVVLTAVVLKSFAAMQFRSGDRWQLPDGSEGGIDLAVRFLADQITLKGDKPDSVGEDIWDACQAAIALADFDNKVPVAMVRRIAQNWRIFYESACKVVPANRWCGPAYLAAMIEVMVRYRNKLDDDPIAPAIQMLLSLEELKDGVSHGFKAVPPNAKIDMWTSSLVLRTLCTLPPVSRIERATIERLAEALLVQFDSRVWEDELGEAPMYCARALHGLIEAHALVNDDLRSRIRDAVQRGNRRIEELLKANHGDLKAKIAVAEYLSHQSIKIAAGLLFDVAGGLALNASAGATPQSRPGGLRLVWLSDLHLAAEDKNTPSAYGPVKRFINRFMQLRGTNLSQYFQAQNLNTILERVRDISPDHILVSGDLTNYAQKSQFETVHSEFLATQSSIRFKRGQLMMGELDPALWTILPGNHDITAEEASDDPIRFNLGLFFKFFAEVYPNAASPFPLVKFLKGQDGAFGVRLYGLDSNVNHPVWRVGVNARGRIDAQQLDDLNRSLHEPKAGPGVMTLIALHHHPIVVPNLVSAAEEFFLSLAERDGKRLVKVCANSGVSAILHGHFHRFSVWSGLTPQKRQMAIIGSAAGTLTEPGVSEQFLELREASRELPTGIEEGLALFVHLRQENGWTETYGDIFLPFNEA